MHPIRRTLISSATLAALALPITGLAQDRAGAFDDRWYVTGGAGVNIQDSARDTENTPTYTLGVGKFITPDWSVDLELNAQNPKLNPDEDMHWSQYGVSLDARRHWRTPGRTWNPYVLMGVGYSRSEEEYNAFPSPDSPGERKSGYPTAKLGVGVQGDFQRFSLRGELLARASFDDDSRLAPDEDHFVDAVAQMAVVVPLGAPRLARTAGPAPVVAVDQPAYEPHVQPPTTDAPMMLELPTVYFGFDRADLTAQGRQALEEAAAWLREHPGVRVRVSGHTDAIGSQAYNQGLSERRARTAYDYLRSLGVPAAQMEGPVGHGETRPVAPNTHPDGSDNPEGRALNRRVDVDAQR